MTLDETNRHSAEFHRLGILQLLPACCVQPVENQHAAGHGGRSWAGMEIQTMESPDRCNSLPACSDANKPFAINRGLSGAARGHLWTRVTSDAVTPPAMNVAAMAR